MSKTVDFIFDVASPNAYFVHQVLPDFAARTSATINYIPCLLGGIFRATGNTAPMIKNASIKNLSAYDMLETRRFIAKHSLTKFIMNPHFPVNTLLLMRGAVVAAQDGELARYVNAVFHHMWETPKKMDDPGIAAAALTESGFDGPELIARTQDDAVKARLVANTEAAVARGAFGIPTFFIGDEMFYGKERLGQIEELLGDIKS
jgi:2-hydroxychromene-2-carboxylate isomerase